MRVCDKGQIASFQEALYHAECGVCGENLPWEAEFDADGTNYVAECCKRQYWMNPYQVLLTFEEGEET